MWVRSPNEKEFESPTRVHLVKTGVADRNGPLKTTHYQELSLTRTHEIIPRIRGTTSTKIGLMGFSSSTLMPDRVHFPPLLLWQAIALSNLAGTGVARLTYTLPCTEIQRAPDLTVRSSYSAESKLYENEMTQNSNKQRLKY